MTELTLGKSRGLLARIVRGERWQVNGLIARSARARSFERVRVVPLPWLSRSLQGIARRVQKRVRALTLLCLVWMAALIALGRFSNIVLSIMQPLENPLCRSDRAVAEAIRILPSISILQEVYRCTLRSMQLTPALAVEAPQNA